eukprot:CAMPEP_0194498214 /NCGR_PEP_ID=MMETSP0253-20130528/14910_1 /TAXON_ID=2966 /ORGANISM="Noctiluca scintillans" /LENGTH=69 /DNA_ID=CAMNT_0039339821 /DNA_START=416 /DNA_END=626 /DNA_ORIENTATION=+
MAPAPLSLLSASTRHWSPTDSAKDGPSLREPPQAPWQLAEWRRLQQAMSPVPSSLSACDDDLSGASSDA